MPRPPRSHCGARAGRAGPGPDREGAGTGREGKGAPRPLAASPRRCPRPAAAPSAHVTPAASRQARQPAQRPLPEEMGVTPVTAITATHPRSEVERGGVGRAEPIGAREGRGQGRPLLFSPLLSPALPSLRGQGRPGPQGHSAVPARAIEAGASNRAVVSCGRPGPV